MKPAPTKIFSPIPQEFDGLTITLCPKCFQPESSPCTSPPHEFRTVKAVVR